MLDIMDIKLKCHWSDAECTLRERDCDGCPNQPADDDKKHGKAAPVYLNWTPDEGGYKIPECPSCGQMPYSVDRCVFCGQRFISDERVEEWKNSGECEITDCSACGAKNAYITGRAYNGHRHGFCTKCGIQYHE